MSINIGNVYQISSLFELQKLVQECNNKNHILILDTYASWCGPCKAIAPFFAGLSVNPIFTEWVTFAKVNIDDADEITQHLQITSIPTFYVFHNDIVPSANYTGACKDQLVTFILKHKDLVITSDNN